MKDDIMVSICCITYNHEKYIREALDSFLMQKTNFKYEIIIHDDASTDNTANIIREYEKKYPDIIKPIYQKENQYSQGEEITSIVFKRAIGKYIALCEGDDYWCDENKLQEQFDYMEKNNECTLCFHDAYVLNMQNNKQEEWDWYNKRFWKKDGNYNAGELDLLDFIPTASVMLDAKCVQKLPEWYKKCVVGDRPLRLIVTSYGYAHYINKKMSIYRVGIGNSAMDTINKRTENVEERVKHCRKIQWIIDEFNSYSNYMYKKELQVSKDLIEIHILETKQEYKSILKEKKYRKILGIKRNLKLVLKIYLPSVHKALKSIKNKIKKED